VSSTEAQKGVSSQTLLEQVSLSRLLFALLHRRLTGTVKLDQPEPDAGRRTIWMRGGMPVFTDWVSVRETLGQVLLGSGAITPDQLSEALANVAEGQLIGQALVERGVTDTATIARALRDQCSRKLVHAFKLRSGTANIKAVEHGLGKDDEHGQIYVLNLIQRGVSLHYDERRVLKEMGAVATRHVQATGAFERYRAQFGFRADDEAILTALLRGTHFQALLGLPGMDRERAAQVTYVLWACQMLTVDEKGARPTAEVPPARAPSPAATRPPSTAPPRAPAPKPPPQDSKAASAPPERRAEAGKPSAAEQPPTPAPAPGSEAATFEDKLSRIEARIEAKAHAFDLLEVRLDATKRDIRNAWTDLSRTFHPDALQAKNLGYLSDRVEKVFAALSEAQLVLADADKRKELKDIIESGGDPSLPPGDATAIARAALESEVLAREGDKLIHAAKFDRALAAFEQAVELNPNESDFQASIVWCRYQLSGKTHDDAREAAAGLEQILEESPNLGRAHYYRGLVLLRMGNEHLALAAFNEAYKADPKLTDAERQARAIMLRRSQPKKKRKKGGLFGR
jgi:curved DNA-binding protein CbpA